MRPSLVLDLKRDEVRAAVDRFRLVNPRVFGAALRGVDQDGGHLDLLVDAPPGITLFDLGALHDALVDLLGVHVALLTPADLPLRIRDKVLAQAQPI